MTTVTLRPMRRSDLPLLARWLAQPHVERWWSGEPQDLEAVEAKYGPCIDGEDPTELFVVEEAGRPVGMIQRYRIADHPEWASVLVGIVAPEEAAGIDYLIGEPDTLGRGVGTAAIAAAVPEVFAAYGVTAIVASVQQANRPSWRALERCGFVRAWAGDLDSPDPSDAGPAFIYLLDRLAGQPGRFSARGEPAEDGGDERHADQDEQQVRDRDVPEGRDPAVQ